MAARRLSPTQIPLSGEERLNARNYSSIHLEGPSGQSFLVDALHEDRIDVSEFDGSSYSLSRSLNWREAAALRLEIVQYFKREELRFNSAWAFLISQFIQMHRWRHALDKAAQGLYNRRQLMRADRLQLLRLLVERALDVGQESVSALMLLREINTRRLTRHPDLRRSLVYLSLHLESLVAAEDARNAGGMYRVTPQGLTTLSRFEDEERRHMDMRKIQYGAMAFAAVTALGVLFKTEQIQYFLQHVVRKWLVTWV